MDTKNKKIIIHNKIFLFLLFLNNQTRPKRKVENTRRESLGFLVNDNGKRQVGGDCGC